MRPSLATLLDSNAGAPLHPTVREALFAFMGSELAVGNPSSLHGFGRAAEAFVAEAGVAILRTFRVAPGEWRVTFTSGGTEANRLAIRAGLTGKTNPTWAVSEVEHSSVLDLIPEMKRVGVRVLRLRPEETGAVRNTENAIGSADLASVIGVGNETGLVQSSLTSHIQSAKAPNASQRTLYHTDFIAGWGKADLDLSTPGAPDLVTITGHKLGGLAGSGAIIHRSRIEISRPGTPNLVGIASLKALADRMADIRGEYARLRELRDAFERGLKDRFSRIRITGADAERVPNVSHFTVTGMKKDLSLVAQLDLRGFAVSAGSACASRAPTPSHVLLAMGYSEIDARNSLRVSLHPGNTSAELAAFTDALGEILRRHEAL